MTRPGAVVVVGESIAGLSAARELRARGYDGPLTMIGREPEGAYARPPLSKEVLRSAAAETGLAYPSADLDLQHVRSPAVALDTSTQTVTTESGQVAPYDALLVATGATARRLAAPGQRGELVLRTLADARAIRERMDRAASVIVIGAGFLGMEVASAAAARGLDVTVADTEPPLRRLLGPYLSDRLSARAAARGVRVRQVGASVGLAGDPVHGVVLPGGDTLTADLVITCAGDVPEVDWLSGTPLAGPAGIAIDERCSTSVPGVFAAGDVARLCPRGGGGGRAPFWSSAVAQGKVAAASMLGQDSPLRPTDDYFWTEILGLPIKIAGPLPLAGEPTSVDGDVAAGDAVLRWNRPGRGTTAVAFGRKVPVGRLRAIARDGDPITKERS